MMQYPHDSSCLVWKHKEFKMVTVDENNIYKKSCLIQSFPILTLILKLMLIHITKTTEQHRDYTQQHCTTQEYYHQPHHDWQHVQISSQMSLWLWTLLRRNPNPLHTPS